jgi:hypothetical protein
MKNTESNYSLKEARNAVQWYKRTYGIDHSQLLGFYVPGDALDDFVNKLYNGKLGKNLKSTLVNS